MNGYPQLTWPGLPGPPQGPLPVAPAIAPDETGTPSVQQPLAPRPEPLSPFAPTTADQTPLPSHSRYGFNPSTVDARGPGVPAARWWAGMDEEAIYRNGLPAVSREAPPSPPFVAYPISPTPPELPLPPPYSPPPMWPAAPPATDPNALTWLGQNLTWLGQPIIWRP